MDFIVPRLVGNDRPHGRLLRTASAKRENATCRPRPGLHLDGAADVIWIMHEQFDMIPLKLDQAALFDGCSVRGMFLRIVLPIAPPARSQPLSFPFFRRNEYVLEAFLTSTDAKTFPVMVASQTGSQGINWW